MDAIAELLAGPAAWAALVTLVVMEVVLGIDNLIFISVTADRLPKEQQALARRVGTSLSLPAALGCSLLMLGSSTLFALGWRRAPGCALPTRRAVGWR